MAWTYKVSSRKFYLDGVYQFEAKYSGSTGYKDDSAMECVKGKGPLPRGKYTIGKPFTHAKTGVWTLRLTAHTSNAMCGRDGFLIHGDSNSHPGEASQGCIVLKMNYRKQISSSNDNQLVVES